MKTFAYVWEGPLGIVPFTLASNKENAMRLAYDVGPDDVGRVVLVELVPAIKDAIGGSRKGRAVSEQL